MARDYSAAYKSTLSAVSAPEAPLVLITIDHDDLDTPVRLVNDTQDITSNGDLYAACAFRFVPPEDKDGQMARARLAIDNIGRDLMYWLEVSNGGTGASVTVYQVMRSRPDDIEDQFTMDLVNVSANMIEVSGELAFDNAFMRPAVQRRYDPSSAPGMF